LFFYFYFFPYFQSVFGSKVRVYMATLPRMISLSQVVVCSSSP